MKSDFLSIIRVLGEPRELLRILQENPVAVVYLVGSQDAEQDAWVMQTAQQAGARLIRWSIAVAEM